MKIFSFKLMDIFLKDIICLLKKKFLSSICCLKNNAVNQLRSTIIFQENNKDNRGNEDNKNNSDVLLKTTIKVTFFLLLLIFILILCFLPVVFSIKEITALPSTPLILPLSGELTVGFRQEYFDEIELVTRKHTGVDIAGRSGDAVMASGNGTVAYTGFSAIGGRTVVIKHNENIRSTYLNILDCFVTKGERVSQGDIIASIGAVDDPSLKESHLHFGIIYMDSYLDPEDVLNIDYTSITRFISLEYISPDINLQTK
jgi:murein DD-endopeptidase MepM/ murein hydrolase activator NlpD